MSKKGENIRKRKDGRWEGRYKKGYKNNGGTLYGSVYGKSYREVKEKMQKVSLTSTNQSKSKNTSNLTFKQLLQIWQTANSIKFKNGTKNKYENLIRTHIIPELGAMKLSELNTTVINDFLNEKLQNGRLDGSGGLSHSYVRSISVIISSAINFAVTEELCFPLKNGIKKPSLRKTVPKVMSVEDQKTLERDIRQNISPEGIGVLLSLYTGLRIGEVCALSWKDIDFRQKIIYVNHTVSRIISDETDRKTVLILDEPKTVSSKRIIPIPSQIFQILYDYSQDSKSPYVVSTTESFVSPRTFSERVHRLFKKSNVKKLNYHGLRHTFATRCIEVGVDIKSLSEILGHSNVSITLNTYVHSSMEMKKTQLEKLNFYNND